MQLDGLILWWPVLKSGKGPVRLQEVASSSPDERPDCSEALSVNVLQKVCLPIQEKSHESLNPHILSSFITAFSTLFYLVEGLCHLRGMSKARACPGFPESSPLLPGTVLTTLDYITAKNHQSTAARRGQLVVMQTPKEPKPWGGS